MNNNFIEVERLKFWPTEFGFMDKKELNDHFDKALISGVEVYKGEMRRYLKEVYDIYFSFYWMGRILSVINLAISLFIPASPLKWAIMGVGIFGIAKTILFYVLTRRTAERITLNDAHDDLLEEAMYAVREDLINNNKEKA